MHSCCADAGLRQRLAGTADKACAMPAVSLSLSPAVFIIQTLFLGSYLVPGLQLTQSIEACITASSCLQLIRFSRASLGSAPDQGFKPFPGGLSWEVRMWPMGMEFWSREVPLPPAPRFGGAGAGGSIPAGCSRQPLSGVELRITNNAMAEQGYLRLSATDCRVSYE